MSFKFKNFLTFNSFEHIYDILYINIRSNFIQILKNYFLKKINIKYNTKYFIFLIDFLCFKIVNTSTFILDNIQKVNSKILIYLPLKFVDNIRKNNIFFYYFLGEFPIYDNYKNYIINGLKKTFVQKLNINYSNIFFNSFIKGNTEVYYAKLILNSTNNINIVLEEKSCFILFNNIKFTFIEFVYFFNISIQDIFYLSRYNSLSFFKEIILNGYKIYFSNSNYIFNILKLNYILSDFFKYNIHLNNNVNYNNKYKVKYYLGNIFNNYFSLIDFVFIIDILFDLKSKRKQIKEIYNYEYRNIETFDNYYSIFFKKYLKKLKNNIFNDLINVLKLNTLSNAHMYIQSKTYIKLKEHLTINPLIQYVEQINSFSEISHKNRVSNYNLKTTQNLNLRDVHLNQLGSLCLIDTTESINCGLIVSFSKYIKTYNSIVFPYYFINEYKVKQHIKYINFSAQETYYLLFNILYLRKNKLLDYCILSLHKESFKLKHINLLYNIIYINPQNLFSFSENLIPFLYNNEPTRCLMASKMQMQSIPTLKKNKSYIVTGTESDILKNSEVNIKTFQDGIVTYVSSYKIVLRDVLNRKIIYYLNKYKKSNQNTIRQYKPIVWVGEKVFSGQNLACICDVLDSEFVIGNNILINYGNFYGYNFEDAIVLNKRVVYKQLFTSLHFDIYETNYKQLKDNIIEIPSINIPKISYIRKRNLNFNGLIKEGSKILDNDILFSKINIKSFNIELYSLTSFIYLLFGANLREIKNVSTIISCGNSGRVIKTEIYSNNIFNFNWYLKIRVYICKQRMLSIGDKICGRYGNKGVVAYIVSNNEVPFSSFGFSPDVITDALGVPSRLNIGQLFESLFGLNCYISNKRICITNTLNYNTSYYKSLIYNNFKKSDLKKYIYNFYSPGKIILRDGRTGFKFNEPSFMGVAKYSKLIHMVKDKIHYRVIGPYTEILQQPVKGRSNMGGQRFGEMEVWALESYGASYNLRELLNYKSDDIKARHSLQYNILNNEKLEYINTSESFKSLIRELNGMFLNIEAFSIIDQLDTTNVSVNINY